MLRLSAGPYMIPCNAGQAQVKSIESLQMLCFSRFRGHVHEALGGCRLKNWTFANVACQRISHTVLWWRLGAHRCFDVDGTLAEMPRTFATQCCALAMWQKEENACHNALKNCKRKQPCNWRPVAIFQIRPILFRKDSILAGNQRHRGIMDITHLRRVCWENFTSMLGKSFSC